MSTTKSTKLASLTPFLALIVLSGLAFIATPAFAGPGPGFGIEHLEVSATNKPTPEQQEKNELGAPDTQAGSHPYELTTSFELNRPELISTKPNVYLMPGRGLKDVRAELPPGFAGNPNAVPKCSGNDFTTDTCPADTAVGLETTRFIHRFKTGEWEQVENSVYNLEAPPGVTAEFGFHVAAEPVLLNVSVRTGGDYGLTVDASNISQGLELLGSTVKVWGVPSEPSHDPVRGEHAGGSGGCLVEAAIEESEVEEDIDDGITPPHELSACEAPGSLPVQPFLTNPTSCDTSRTGKVSVDDWEDPGSFVSKPATLPPLTGCGKLDFSPSIEVEPDGRQGSTPTGLNVDLHVNQESTTNPNGLGEADVKDTTVTLPAGVQISPAAADGLEACTGNPADKPGQGQLGTPGDQIGFEGYEEFNPVSERGVQTDLFTPRMPGSLAATEAGESEPLKPGENFCPNAAKIATVKIKTPVLEDELEGSVYLAAPQNFSLASGAPLENPFSSLMALYLVAEDPARGVLIKLPGEVTLCNIAGEDPVNTKGEPIADVTCQAPGQIVTTFLNTPELPFSDLKLEFYGTDRAPLATPALCGTYNTETSLTPWSGNPAAHPPASFQISNGPATASYPDGSPCPNPPGDQSLSTLPFSPSLASGTTNINAGSFSNLDTTLSREDGQQSIQSVTLHYPAGLSGLLSGVELCPEAQANAGTCGPSSQIGETIVSVGLGNDPFTVTGGKVYITGPYDGTGPCTVGESGCAPFGLSIVNPAKAGPFDLQEGRPVVVRATINVDPHTAALTITTNTAAQGYAIPTIIDGIPLQIKHVYVNINRPGFTFNPTNCNPTKITGEIKSAEGSTSPVEDAFQVTNCAQLKFEPKFSVSTQGKTSKANGASLTAKVTYPSAAAGTYANVAKVKVELPLQLPSRLKTLQKACLAAVFAANPAACPPESRIGYAVVHTPLIPVPLEGPAIFVSHGGEAFPSLTMVLQGYGVTIDLVGATYISPAGITSTTFKTVPDQPFSSFELTLPEGPYSALAANGNLCKPTKTETVKKKVKVKVHGHKKTVTKKVKETVPTTLVMPNEFVGQNGAVIKQDSTVTVTSCPKAVKTSKKHKGKKGKKKK
jgi:hypothetical protein